LNYFIVKRNLLTTYIFSTILITGTDLNISILVKYIVVGKMALSDRIRVIIKESGLNQKKFAKSLNVTDSYISKLLRDESGMSNTTVMLIEKLYGYSRNWIIQGEGQQKDANLQTKDLSPLQKKILADIEQMNIAELRALSAFIESLKVYQKEVTGG
jgi:transcriptional regulator with XRE-family HTH domain